MKKASLPELCNYNNVILLLSSNSSNVNTCMRNAQLGMFGRYKSERVSVNVNNPKLLKVGRNCADDEGPEAPLGGSHSRVGATASDSHVIR